MLRDWLESAQRRVVTKAFGAPPSDPSRKMATSAVELTRIEAVSESAESNEKTAGSLLLPHAHGPEPAIASEPTSASSRPSETREAEPVTVDVLQRKLDAAILAEAWHALKTIRERIAQVERTEAGNVVPIEGARRRRRP
jgi:hypothetical protein